MQNIFKAKNKNTKTTSVTLNLFRFFLKKVSIVDFEQVHMVCCTIWYYFYNLKNVKNTHGGKLILVKLQMNTPPWVFFTLFKWYK